jgi:hypothetical protein
MNSLEVSILKTVAYFDIFSYPLTISDIVLFLDCPASEEEVSITVQHLIETKNLWKFDNFYSARNEESFATNRIKGNKLAKQHIKKSMSLARFLFLCPYIKGIAISGSLSKNYADENSDFDFFIITSANRLWIVRAFYTALFKIASFARIKHWFCLNYFIDESSLEINEHNIFTAIELLTLKPLKGKAVFDDFFKMNTWANEYLPNCKVDHNYLKDSSPNVMRRIIEWAMNFEIGNKIDNKLLSLFKKRFQKVLSKNMVTDKGLVIGSVEASKHSCKPLAQYFQPRILSKFQKNFQQILNRYQNSLPKTYSLSNKYAE